MMAKKFTRTLKHSDGSAELFSPHAYSCGHYKVFKRFHGDSKQKASGATHITWDDIENNIGIGMSLWMRGDRLGPPVLISPEEIEVV
jgi:hypothetical protein